MRLVDAFRYQAPHSLALAGAGGKTTTLLRLAAELSGPVCLSTTTHLSLEQTHLADRHIIVETRADLDRIDFSGEARVTLITGIPGQYRKIGGLSFDLMETLAARLAEQRIPLIIEADGAKMLPLKAPAGHEPAIPPFVDQVVYLAGLDGLGTPLDDSHVHRPELFSALSGLSLGAAIDAQSLARVLTHPQGGLKSIPGGARRALLLNKADTAERREAAGRLADLALPAFDAVVAASLGQPGAPVHWARERIAGIVLAAGGSTRLGRPKQLIEWQGEKLVHRAARTALAGGLDPVLVVCGAHGDEISAAVADLPVRSVINPDWESGQSSSIRAGLRALPEQTGGAFFILSDQPFVTPELFQRLVAAHSRGLTPVTAPFVGEQRANPVLFDRDTFPELLSLQGDVGGRAILSRYPIARVDWPDANLLLDVDVEADVERLRAVEAGPHG